MLTPHFLFLAYRKVASLTGFLEAGDRHRGTSLPFLHYRFVDAAGTAHKRTPQARPFSEGAVVPVRSLNLCAKDSDGKHADILLGKSGHRLPFGRYALQDNCVTPHLAINNPSAAPGFEAFFVKR